VLVAIVTIKRKMRAFPSSQAFAQGFLLWVLVAFFALVLHAQEIRIRVLNARNGKPISNECVNVWTGTWHGAHLVATTNKNGIAVLRLADNEILAETACPGWPAQASRRSGVDAITISADYYVACQEYGKITPGEPTTDPLSTMPSYPIKRILESGITAANACGKFTAEAKPGELVFFVRPRKFLERMRQ
jgi:hypothetical protein